VRPAVIAALGVAAFTQLTGIEIMIYYSAQATMVWGSDLIVTATALTLVQILTTGGPCGSME
jgi:hypothetical protein